ncbi:DUF397 domain-containing protein [Streptomyces sp. NPDC049585]|uniref:DUF397 domain-containing protein n=1 Tax=Streptomyces sp. NPDC049585 TaxID=3155154 RepID=UPI003424B661
MSCTTLHRVDVNGAVWRKSSHSGHQSDCLQVADGFPAWAPVRDSKRPYGSCLVFRRAAWANFIAALKRSELPAFD